MAIPQRLLQLISQGERAILNRYEITCAKEKNCNRPVCTRPSSAPVAIERAFNDLRSEGGNAEPMRVTREELYALVWTDPVTKAAKRFGISVVALGKVCKKMLVPKPPPGYWARRQHGKPVQQTPLPEPTQGAVLSWVFSRPTSQRTAEELPVETKVKMEEERLPERKILVPEQLDKPHALIARTRSVPAKIKADEYPVVSSREEDCLALRVSHQTLPRVLRILDAWLKALEARGAIIHGRGNYHPFATHLRIDGETVGFHMTERIARSDHVPTEAEIKRLERRG